MTKIKTANFDKEMESLAQGVYKGNEKRKLFLQVIH